MKDSPNLTAALTFSGSPAGARPNALQLVTAAVQADRAIYWFIVAYSLAVSLIGLAVGAQRKVLPLTLYVGAIQLALMLALFVVAGCGIWALKSRNALESFKANLSRAVAHAPNLLVLIALCIFMVVFSSMKQMLTDVVPFYADASLANIDAFLHGHDAWRIAVSVMPVSLVHALEALYLQFWGASLFAATIAVLYLPALRGIRHQYLWTFLIAWTLLGNLIAGCLMSAGPVFYQNVTGSARFSELMAYLSAHTHQAWIHGFLWRAYSGLQPGVTGAGISAFPSMHVASATLCALVAFRVGGWLRWVGIAYCASITFGSILLGWHYAVDGYFSILATVVIWKVVGRRLDRQDTTARGSQPPFRQR
jgi:hypothetical protein